MDIIEQSSMIDDDESSELTPSIVDIWYCPNCKRETRNDAYIAELSDEYTDQMYQLCKCAVCGKPFFFAFQRPKPEPVKEEQIPIPPMSGMFPPVTYFPSLKDLIFSYPIHVQELDKSIPPNIRRSYEQAIRCMMFGAPDATLAMLRKTLQRICKNKNTTKTELAEQINEIMPDELKEEARQVKKWGDVAVHSEFEVSNVSIDQVRRIKEFMDKILLSLYVHPAKLKSSKKKIDEIKSKK